MRQRTPLNDVRQLARILLDEAGQGDAVARRIVQEHGAALGDYALAAARRVGIDHMPFTLVLAGGVFRHPVRLLIEALVERVRSVAPDVQVVQSQLEPVVGALLLAFDAVSIHVSESMQTQLLETLPPTDFFAT